MKGNNFLSVILLVTLLCLFIHKGYAQSRSGKNFNKVKKAIAASNSIYFQSFVKNDPSIFIDRYADDCLIMLPNAPVIKGRKGAFDFFKIAYNKIGLRNGKFLTTAIYGLGDDYVTEEGIWQSFDKNNKMFDNGKFLVLWKKTSRGWKMFRDSFSSDRAK